MNDAAAENLPTAENKPSGQPEADTTRDNAPLRPGEFDPLADAGAQLETPGENGSENTIAGRAEKKPRKPLIEFYSPSQLKNYVVPPDQCLVGDYHLQRAAPSVLAGPGGRMEREIARLRCGCDNRLSSRHWLLCPCFFKATSRLGGFFSHGQKSQSGAGKRRMDGMRRLNVIKDEEKRISH